MNEIEIYILMEHIIPIPIAVEGFYPIIISPGINTQGESVYVNLYDNNYVNVFFKGDRCGKFNGMYYLYQRGDLPPWVGVCTEKKYFWFKNENVKSDGEKRGANFAEIIAPSSAKDLLKSYGMVCAKPLAVDDLFIAAMGNKEKAGMFLRLYKIICETKPCYEAAFMDYMFKDYYFPNDMFVTSRALFIDYVDVTASVIKSLEKERFFFEESLSVDEVAEIMLNIFLINKKIKVGTCPVMNCCLEELNFS